MDYQVLRRRVMVWQVSANKDDILVAKVHEANCEAIYEVPPLEYEI